MRGKAGLFSRFQPFSPAVLAGLAMWIDASDPATVFDSASGGSTPADNGNVWRVQSKVGGLSWSASGAFQTAIRRVSERNGRDVIRCDQTFPSRGTELIGPGIAAFVSSSAYTVFAAVSYASFFNANDQLIQDTSGQHRFFALAQSQITGVANSSITVSRAYTLGTWATFTQRFSGSESELSMRVNGGDAATASVSSLSGISVAFQTRIPFVSSCDIGEIIAYNVALSDSDRQAVESYLMAKWGIT
jgi:hypothetical protein